LEEGPVERLARSPITESMVIYKDGSELILVRLVGEHDESPVRPRWCETSIMLVL
jgi:hypothetical protein